MPKISHLLQIGFGAAGAEIIRKNMGAGALNAVMPGGQAGRQQGEGSRSLECCHPRQTDVWLTL